VRDGVVPLLTCDVWEHAYYVDYKQDRKGFLEQWFDKVVNWPFVEAQFAASKGKGAPYAYPAPTYG
jgi:Fe-Mn family superoxide dismutase